MPVSKKQNNHKSLGSPFWEKQVKSYQDSGLSQGEYCRRKRLKLSAFGYWYRKLSHEKSENNKVYTKRNFIEISEIVKNRNQSNSITNASIEIEFQNGWKIKIPPTWEHENLKRLLALIKEEACL